MPPSKLDNLWTCLIMKHARTHAHTHWSTRWWLMIGRLLTGFPLSFFSHRGGIQAPTHPPTHANPHLAWLRSVQRDSVKSVHLRLTGQVLFHLPVSSYHEQQRGVAIPSTKTHRHTHTRTGRHTRRRAARVVGSTAWEQQSHFSPASEAWKLWGMWVYSRTFRWAGTESFFTEVWIGHFLSRLNHLFCFVFYSRNKFLWWDSVSFLPAARGQSLQVGQKKRLMNGWLL